MANKFVRTNRPAPPEIRPNGVYDRQWIIANLRVSKDAIAEAELSGHLKCAPMGKGYRYLGVWLIRWLQIRSTIPRDKGKKPCDSEAA